ncbi:MAG: hypothetical protein VCF25_33635 [Candidatus Poribacteria bacterium]
MLHYAVLEAVFLRWKIIRRIVCTAVFTGRKGVNCLSPGDEELLRCGQDH